MRRWTVGVVLGAAALGAPAAGGSQPVPTSSVVSTSDDDFSEAASELTEAHAHELAHAIPPDSSRAAVGGADAALLEELQTPTNDSAELEAAWLVDDATAHVDEARTADLPDSAARARSHAHAYGADSMAASDAPDARGMDDGQAAVGVLPRRADELNLALHSLDAALADGEADPQPGHGPAELAAAEAAAAAEEDRCCAAEEGAEACGEVVAAASGVGTAEREQPVWAAQAAQPAGASDVGGPAAAETAAAGAEGDVAAEVLDAEARELVEGLPLSAATSGQPTPAGEPGPQQQPAPPPAAERADAAERAESAAAAAAAAAAATGANVAGAAVAAAGTGVGAAEDEPPRPEGEAPSPDDGSPSAAAATAALGGASAGAGSTERAAGVASGGGGDGGLSGVTETLPPVEGAAPSAMDAAPPSAPPTVERAAPAGSEATAPAWRGADSGADAAAADGSGGTDGGGGVEGLAAGGIGAHGEAEHAQTRTPRRAVPRQRRMPPRPAPPPPRPTFVPPRPPADFGGWQGGGVSLPPSAGLEPTGAGSAGPARAHVVPEDEPGAPAPQAEHGGGAQRARRRRERAERAAAARRAPSPPAWMGGAAPAALLRPWERVAADTVVAVGAGALTHPLDVLKVRAQVTGQRAAAGAASEARRFLFSGLSAGVAHRAATSVVQSAAQLALSPPARAPACLGARRGASAAATECASPRAVPAARALRVLASCGAAALACPLEVALVRMQTDLVLPPAQRRGYRSVHDALWRILSQEGVRTLWRGALATTVRAGVVATASCAAVSCAPAWLGGADARALALRAALALAVGAAGSIASLPIDALKSLRQHQVRPPGGQLAYGSISQAAAKVTQADGVHALWRGILPAVATTAITSALAAGAALGLATLAIAGARS